LKIIGFVLKSLSGGTETERFVPESYITYKEDFNRQNTLKGSMVPSKEAAVFFPTSPGKLLTRYVPSVFLPKSIEVVPGTFQDDSLLHPPIKGKIKVCSYFVL